MKRPDIVSTLVAESCCLSSIPFGPSKAGLELNLQSPLAKENAIRGSACALNVQRDPSGACAIDSCFYLQLIRVC